MNWYNFRSLAITFLTVCGLAACQTPPDEGPSEEPIQETLERLDSSAVLAEAFVKSPFYDDLANYPVTVFYIFEEKFTVYLSENGLTKESFLQSDRLDDFLGRFFIEGINLAEDGAGTYMTKAGNTLEIRDVSDSSVGGTFVLTANGDSVTCEIRLPEEGNGSFCYIDEPLVDFNW